MVLPMKTPSDVGSLGLTPDVPERSSRLSATLMAECSWETATVAKGKLARAGRAIHSIRSRNGVPYPPQRTPGRLYGRFGRRNQFTQQSKQLACRACRAPRVWEANTQRR